MKKLMTIFFFVLVTNSFAQVIYTQEDVAVCESKFELAVDSSLACMPINEVIIEIGRSFLGTEYAAHSLEKGDKEKLVVHLTGLDCYTFLESSLVFARCIKSGKTTFTDFQKELTNVRYRNGVIDGYPSRLHYFSDWIYDLDKRGLISDVSNEIGGVAYKNNVNFMSTHPSSYDQLVNNPAYIEKMDLIEKMISSRSYFYVPQNSIESVEPNINTGDIIGITTDIGGLDIIHTGIAIRLDDGRIHFMHSPNVGKKVQISKRTLADYIKDHKRQTGIMVIRALEPVTE